MNATAIGHRIDNLAANAIGLIRRAANPAEEQTTADITLTYAIDALRAILNLQRGKPVCPGCNGLGLRRETGGVAHYSPILDCQRCGGIFTDRALLGVEALQVVALSGHMLANAGPAGTFYFDFEVASDGKIHRMHGWADKATKRVVQWG